MGKAIVSSTPYGNSPGQSLHEKGIEVSLDLRFLVNKLPKNYLVIALIRPRKNHSNKF